MRFSPHFLRRFAAVATVAEALEIARVGEGFPVSAMRPDVVHVRGPLPDAPCLALPAPGLPKELRRPELTPGLRAVHPAPGLGVLASSVPVLGPVILAVAARHQHAAARMLAGAEWLCGHGLSPPGKTKSQRPLSSQDFSGGRSRALANHVALTICDIDDVRGFAPPAPKRQVSGRGVWPQCQVGFLPAIGADDQAVFYYGQFTAFFCTLQGLFPHFLLLSVNIHKVSRRRNQ